jgi:hypothetical protein
MVNIDYLYQRWTFASFVDYSSAFVLPYYSASSLFGLSEAQKLGESTEDEKDQDSPFKTSRGRFGWLTQVVPLFTTLIDHITACRSV